MEFIVTCGLSVEELWLGGLCALLKLADATLNIETEEGICYTHVIEVLVAELPAYMKVPLSGQLSMCMESKMKKKNIFLTRVHGPNIQVLEGPLIKTDNRLIYFGVHRACLGLGKTTNCMLLGTGSPLLLNPVLRHEQQADPPLKKQVMFILNSPPIYTESENSKLAKTCIDLLHISPSPPPNDMDNVILNTDTVVIMGAIGLGSLLRLL
ncbi:hypothetical protein C8R44DRAFT_729684 [Mycena epipterygia]|nr:hypothetical protein C8R44DRAFT_729684 [Mycena epipterygia]